METLPFIPLASPAPPTAGAPATAQPSSPAAGAPPAAGFAALLAHLGGGSAAGLLAQRGPGSASGLGAAPRGSARASGGDAAAAADPAAGDGTGLPLAGLPVPWLAAAAELRHGPDPGSARPGARRDPALSMAPGSGSPGARAPAWPPGSLALAPAAQALAPAMGHAPPVAGGALETGGVDLAARVEVPVAIALPPSGRLAASLAGLSAAAADAAAPAPLTDPAAAITAGAGSAGLLGTQSPTSAAQAELPVPPGHPRFADALGARLAWQIGHNVQHAHLNLNPPELGPLEVRVEMNRDQAQLHFVAHHGAVRDAVEDALPRLRELFAQNGLQLADASVSGGSAGGGGGRFTGALPEPQPFPAPAPLDDEPLPGPAMTHRGTALVDAYV